jgi:hypothetical protein
MEGTNRVRTLSYKSFPGLTTSVLAVLALTTGAPDLPSPPSGAQAGPSLSAGSSYYVSPTGNDSNPGTEAQPFRTIGKAATVVQPGNTSWTSVQGFTIKRRERDIDRMVLRHDLQSVG